jgi:hypothetical protein
LTNALLANWGAYQDRLRGVGEGGVQAAGAQSGIDVNAGNTQFAAGQQRAATNTSAANAIAASRSTGINNLIGVGSVIASAMTGMPIPSRAAGGSNALTRGGVGAAPY